MGLLASSSKDRALIYLCLVIKMKKYNFTPEQLEAARAYTQPPIINNYLVGSDYVGICSKSRKARRFQIIPNNRKYHTRIDGEIVDVIIPRGPILDWCTRAGEWKTNNLWGGGRLASSINGVLAELCACLCLNPGFIIPWSKTAAVIPTAHNSGKNTGRDLRKEWTGADRDIEVKSTSNPGYQYVLIPSLHQAEGIDPCHDLPNSYYIHSVSRQYKFGYGCTLQSFSCLELMEPFLKWDPIPLSKHNWGIDKRHLIPFCQIDNHVKWDENVF